MKRFLPLLLLACAAAAPAADPYLWLEEVEEARALDQVKAWNAETEAALTRDPHYEADRARAQAILDDEAQIAMPDAVIGDRVLNLWRDARNPRGLWRVASLDAYLAGKPRWTTLIDVDALGKRERKSWVWHGARCLEPAYTRCLVSLSPGGTDADTVREFDLTTRTFVPGGFALPAAQQSADWVDRNTLLVATDWGPGSMARSGRPRIAKLWTRGTPLSAATTVVEAPASVTSVGTTAFVDATTRRPVVRVGTSFFQSDYWLRDADGRFAKLPLPPQADLADVIDGRGIVRLNKAALGRPAGAVVAYRLDAPQTAPETVFVPGESQAVQGLTATDRVVWINTLDHVSGKLLALTRGAEGRWSQREVPLPTNSSVSLSGSAGKRDLAFATVEGMLIPPTLYAVGGGAPAKVQALPARFDAATMTVVQRFTTSRDGTKVPYFLVVRKDMKRPAPALIHAYGGFRNPQVPTYLTDQPYRAGPLALSFVERGGAYVLANLRGGGEYGPRWHEAGLRDKRQNVFDDLHAVAEDLVRTGVSAKKRIAISGRSNGGLLVGVAMQQRPDLYGAVIAGSPLEDMKRYTKMSAGSLWVDEYGDPDVPADWAFISRYSPYQNVRDGVRYPPVLFYLSTKDDRVHPGHARKLAALLREKGNSVYYHEYLEGGHAVGADHAEDARRAALLQAFLARELRMER